MVYGIVFRGILKSEFSADKCDDSSKAIEQTDRQKPLRQRRTNTVRSDDVVRRIQAAIDSLEARCGCLPQGKTARLNAIIQESKELGQGLAKNTLYRKPYKAIWQDRHLSA
jgi:hypothetical protein